MAPSGWAEPLQRNPSSPASLELLHLVAGADATACDRNDDDEEEEGMMMMMMRDAAARLSILRISEDSYSTLYGSVALLKSD